MGKYETAKTFGGSDKPRALRRRGSWDSPTVRYEWHILIGEVLSKQTTLHTSRQTVSVRTCVGVVLSLTSSTYLGPEESVRKKALNVQYYCQGGGSCKHP